MKNIQLNYQNNKDNRSVERWYADSENEIGLIPQKENTQIYCINDNKMYQMEVLDDEQNLTGEYVSFVGRNKTNIDKLKINFQPQQNLNGFDRPWTGGNGTNQLDFDNATIYKGTVSGTADNFTFTVTGSGATGIFFSLPNSFAGKTMYLSGIITRTGTHANNIAVQLQRKKNGTTSYIAKANYTNNAITLEDLSIELPSDSTSFVLRIIASAAADDSTDETMTVSNLRLCDKAGQTWSPYTNICPIYGHTAMKVVRAGKNFLENNCESFSSSSGFTATVAEDGTFIFNGNISTNTVIYYNIQTGSRNVNTQRDLVKHLPNGTYIASLEGSDHIVLQTYGYNPPNGPLNMIGLARTGSPAVFTIDDTYQYNYCRILLGIATFQDAIAKVMIRPVSISDVTYEQYKGDTYNAQFGRTIYGGTLDFVTGVLTETWGYIASYNGETLSAEWISDRDMYAAGTTPTTGAAVAYRLATSQTYQLTPQEITTLLGENRIWSDSGIITAKIETKGLTLLPIAPIK